MKKSPVAALQEDDITSGAEETLQFGDDNLRAIAEVHKNEGNDEYKKNNFNSAIFFYTEGIKVNCKDEDLNAKLYSNRAAAHFNLGNYSETVSDAKIAIELKPSYLKAFVRGASACIQLKKFKEANTWCDEGLTIDPNNQTLLELRERVLGEQRILQESGGKKRTGTKAEKLGDNKAFGNLGSAYDSGGCFKAAVDYHERILEISRELGDKWNEGAAYGNLGNAYHSLGDFKTAIHYHKRRLEIAEELGDRSGQGKAYCNLGNAHGKLGDIKTAIDYHERHLKIAKELGDRSGEGAANGNLGNAHNSLGDFKTAIDYHKRHLKIAKELCDRLNEGKTYGNLGNALLSLGDIKTAIDYHERNLKIAKEFHDRSGEGMAYGNLGNAYSRLGDFETAIDYHKRDLKIANEVGDRSGEEAAYCNLGDAYHELGDFKTAIDYHKLHLKIAEELGDRSGKGVAYGNLGDAHRSLGDFKTALDYHERQLKIAKEVGERQREGSAYSSLGNTHARLGDSQTAIDYHERHLQIAKELGDRSGEGAAYGNQGNSYDQLGDFKAAIDYHERHLKIAKELRDRSGEGKAYGNLGNAFENLGDFTTAIDHHERHLKIAKELGDRSGEEAANGSLGNAHGKLGDFKTAVDYHERCLQIAKELGDRSGEAGAYGNLGNAHHSLGDFKTAIDYHERDLAIAKVLEDRPGEGSAHGNLGVAYQSLGDTKTAIDYYKRHLKFVKEMGDRSGEGSAYGNLGSAYSSLGDFKTAKDYHELTLKIARELGDPLLEGKACTNLGSSFACLGQVPVAIEYYELAIALFNNIRDRLQLNDEWKISLRDQYQRLYTALWRLILKEGKVTKALFSAEKGRAQGLKDLMELNYVFKENDAELTKKDRTFHELFNRLPPNTIFMATAEKELILWVCQPGKEVEFRRKEVSCEYEINSFFQSLLEKISATDNVQCEDRSLELTKDKRLTDKRSPKCDRQTQDLHSQERALRTLYDIIIDPIQDLLSGSELIFVPDGPLCLAPFAAFMGPDYKYLCESFRIRVAPSLTSLKMIADCPVGHHLTSGVLLVADPWVQDVTTLPPLPFAREEVQMISRVLGSTPLIGIQATKDEVLKRLDSVALVHFAAHGSMEAGEIALAPQNGDMDFILTMKDVKRVQMRARLVVLSCCHSAHGEIKAEGVVGIARAFLGAGARSVLVSLWAIDDEATLEFMKHFYQHLVEGKSASKAVNQAMNCMKEHREFGAVNNWAPFVLIGDDVTLEFGGSK